MAQSGKTAKIAAGATVRRLKKQALHGGNCRGVFSGGMPCGKLFPLGPGEDRLCGGNCRGDYRVSDFLRKICGFGAADRKRSGKILFRLDGGLFL